LLLEKLINLLGIHCFAGLESLDEFLDPKALAFSLRPRDAFCRLSFQVESLHLLAELGDNLILLGNGGWCTGETARGERDAERGGSNDCEESTCHILLSLFMEWKVTDTVNRRLNHAVKGQGERRIRVATYSEGRTTVGTEAAVPRWRDGSRIVANPD
jgi:hypothetical protein